MNPVAPVTSAELLLLPVLTQWRQHGNLLPRRSSFFILHSTRNRTYWTEAERPVGGFGFTEESSWYTLSSNWRTSGNFIVPVQLTPGFDARAYWTVVELDPVIRISLFELNVAPEVHAEFTPLN